jgi:hypothetical protein
MCLGINNIELSIIHQNNYLKISTNSHCSHSRHFWLYGNGDPIEGLLLTKGIDVFVDFISRPVFLIARKHNVW